MSSLISFQVRSILLIKYSYHHLLECYIIASSSVILECPTGEACINDVLQYNCNINGVQKNWIVTEF